jgi:hypothetical protein
VSALVPNPTVDGTVPHKPLEMASTVQDHQASRSTGEQSSQGVEMVVSVEPLHQDLNLRNRDCCIVIQIHFNSDERSEVHRR